MKRCYPEKIKRWGLICGILLMLSISWVGYVLAAVELSSIEKYWLTYIREEEKLARDVYTYMYNRWGSQIFYKLSQSEQQHMDAVKTLLDRYGITDPAANKNPGEFSNPEIQTLYFQLIAQGNVSFVEALKAGVFIEETDINDLNTGIATTSRRDIKNVYNNLLFASQNHLKAFISNLAVQGVVYEP